MTLAIIFTVAIPVALVAAIYLGNAFSRRAVTNSDLAIGFCFGMLFAAICAWIAVLL